MPFDSSFPSVIACLRGAVGASFIWTRVQARWLLAVATFLAILGVAAFVADSLVVTDRECLLALFPRLASAAEKQDVAPIMAALATRRSGHSTTRPSACLLEKTH